MQKPANTDQRGIGHLLLIVVLAVVVGGAGFAAYMVVGKKDQPLADKAASTVASIVAGKECMKEFNDKDLCKFLNSWSSSKKFKVTSTTTADGTTSTSEMTIDGDKSHMKMTGEYAMDVISIGDTTYTKSGDTWWKQTAKKTETPDTPVSKDDFKFEEPKEDSAEKDPTKYEKLAKEACGNLTCFKYKVVDPTNADTTEFIWFDDKDYLIRRTLSESKDGSKTESTFSYDDASITAPSPVKELGPNQYIMPGQAEPATMPEQPSEAEMQAMTQQAMQDYAQ